MIDLQLKKENIKNDIQMTEKNISERKITLVGSKLSSLRTREERMYFKKYWFVIIFEREID